MKTTIQILTSAPGLSRRQLDHWTRLGHISSVDGPAGSGTTRRYPDREAAVALWMARLTRAGFVLPVAALLARAHVQESDDRQVTDHQIAGAVLVRIGVEL